MEDEEEYEGSNHLRAVAAFHAKKREERKKDCMSFYKPKLTCRQRYEIWNSSATHQELAEKYSIHHVNVAVIRKGPRPELCEKHREQ